MSSSHHTDAFHVDLIDPHIKYSQEIFYPDSWRILLINIKMILLSELETKKLSNEHIVKMFDILFKKDLFNNKSSCEQLINSYKKIHKNSIDKDQDDLYETERNVMKLFDIEFDHVDDVIIKEMFVLFEDNNKQCYWNPLADFKETKNLNASKMPLYVSLFLRINYVMYSIGILMKLMEEKDVVSNNKKKQQKRNISKQNKKIKMTAEEREFHNEWMKSHIPYSLKQKKMDEKLHYLNHDIDFKITTTERYRYYALYIRLKMFLDHHLELMIYIDKMCESKKFNELIKELSTPYVYNYFVTNRELKYKYFPIDESFIKTKITKHKEKTNLTIVRELLEHDYIKNDIFNLFKYNKRVPVMSQGELVGELETYNNVSIDEMNLINLNFDQHVIWFKNQLKKSKVNKSLKIHILEKMKYFFPLFTGKDQNYIQDSLDHLLKSPHVEDMKLLDKSRIPEMLIDKEMGHLDISKCVLFYVCMIRINTAYSMLENISKYKEDSILFNKYRNVKTREEFIKKKNIEKLQYNVYLIIMDHLKFSTYMIDKYHFQDLMIVQYQNGVHYETVKPRENTSMTAGNLPDVTSSLLKLDFVFNAKTPEKDPIAIILGKCLPFYCKIRLIDNMIRKHYSAKSHVKLFIDAVIECFLFGLFPRSNHLECTNFGVLIKTHKYIYNGEDVTKNRLRLFESIAKNELVLQTVIRECFVYMIDMTPPLRDFLEDDLWIGEPFVSWDKFIESVEENSGIVRRYYMKYGAIPGKLSKSYIKNALKCNEKQSEENDIRYTKFLESEYKRLKIVDENLMMDSGEFDEDVDIFKKRKTKRKKKADIQWIKPGIYRIYPNTYVDSLLSFLHEIFVENFVLHIKGKHKSPIGMLDDLKGELTTVIDNYEKIGELSNDYINNYEDVFNWLYERCKMNVDTIQMLYETVLMYYKRKSPNSIKSKLRKISPKDYKILKYFLFADKKNNFLKGYDIGNHDIINVLISVQKRDRTYINSSVVDYDDYNIVRNPNTTKIIYTTCCLRVTNFTYDDARGNSKIKSNSDIETLINSFDNLYSDEKLSCCNYNGKNNKKSSDDVIKEFNELDISSYAKDDENVIKEDDEEEVRKEKLINNLLNEIKTKYSTIDTESKNKDDLLVPFSRNNKKEMNLLGEVTKEHKRKRRKSNDPLKSCNIDNETKKDLKKFARKFKRIYTTNNCSTYPNNKIKSVDGLGKLMTAKTKNGETIAYRLCPQCGGFGVFNTNLFINGEYMCTSCTVSHPSRCVFAFCQHTHRLYLIDRHMMEQMLDEELKSVIEYNNKILNKKIDKKKSSAKKKISTINMDDINDMPTNAENEDEFTLSDKDMSRIIISDKINNVFKNVLLKRFIVYDENNKEDGIKIVNYCRKSSKQNNYLYSTFDEHNGLKFMEFIKTSKVYYKNLN